MGIVEDGVAHGPRDPRVLNQHAVLGVQVVGAGVQVVGTDIDGMAVHHDGFRMDGDKRFARFADPFRAILEFRKIRQQFQEIGRLGFQLEDAESQPLEIHGPHLVVRGVRDRVVGRGETVGRDDDRRRRLLFLQFAERPPPRKIQNEVGALDDQFLLGLPDGIANPARRPASAPQPFSLVLAGRVRDEFQAVGFLERRDEGVVDERIGQAGRHAGAEVLHAEILAPPDALVLAGPDHGGHIGQLAALDRSPVEPVFLERFTHGLRRGSEHHRVAIEEVVAGRVVVVMVVDVAPAHNADQPVKQHEFVVETLVGSLEPHERVGQFQGPWRRRVFRRRTVVFQFEVGMRLGQRGNPARVAG